MLLNCVGLYENLVVLIGCMLASAWNDSDMKHIWESERDGRQTEPKVKRK